MCSVLRCACVLLSNRLNEFRLNLELEFVLRVGDIFNLGGRIFTTNLTLRSSDCTLIISVAKCLCGFDIVAHAVSI